MRKLPPKIGRGERGQLSRIRRHSAQELWSLPGYVEKDAYPQGLREDARHGRRPSTRQNDGASGPAKWEISGH